MPSARSCSTEQIIAAMMPLASQAPRPQKNSSSSLKGKKGGTVSMCVDSVTIGVPSACKNVKALRFNLHSFGSRTVFRCERTKIAKQEFAGRVVVKSPTRCQRARVSANRSMVAFCNGIERKRRERPKEIQGCHSSIALHPHKFTTDDSGQVLALAPSLPGIQLPRRLRRINSTYPFRAGVRN